MPERTVSLGEPGTSFFPTSEIDPVSGLSNPLMHRQTASLPDPTSPTRLTISPFFIEKLKGSNARPLTQTPDA